MSSTQIFETRWGRYIVTLPTTLDLRMVGTGALWLTREELQDLKAQIGAILNEQ